MNVPLRVLAPAALLFSLAALAGAADDPPTPSIRMSGASTLAARLAAGATAGGELLVSLDDLRLFYGERGHRPSWANNGGRSPQMDVLLGALRRADREGLRPEEYHLAAIDRLLAQAGPDGDLADLDLLLSDAFFLYARHLTSGRVKPASVESAWNISGRSRDLVFLLGSALDHGHLEPTLQDLAPVREDYRLLREALASHRAVAAAGGWPAVPQGKTLHPGDRSPRVAPLRQRLTATGELAPGTADLEELFDPALAEAVTRFQRRHGLDPDGVVGRRTLAALNVPAHRRVRQIEANLERLRWLPRDLGPRRLLVNIADFHLELAEEGAPPLAMRIIAGKQARRTPFFTGEITSILLNPTWTVPARIAVEDKLPLIREDRFYLYDHGYRVFAHSGGRWREVDPLEIDWTAVSAKRFPYLLRQNPGPQNALGRIKFQIPNNHDIYLHDTPARELFEQSERTFSSGCIRVEHALDLAVRLLGEDPSWTRERIVNVIDREATVSVPLPRPLPVYLLYWTAWVDRDGGTQFREDVYGRDAILLEAMGQPARAP